MDDFVTKVFTVCDYAAERDTRSRLAAAMLCNALGDAAGSPFEFWRGRLPEQESFKLLNAVISGLGGVRGAAPGAVTDDHMMTLLLAQTVLENGGRYDRTRAVLSYITWAQAHPTGIGRNTRRLFQCTSAKADKARLRAYNKQYELAHAEDKIISNGTLMRASGCLVVRGGRDAVVEAAMEDAKVSNNWPENIQANRLYVGMLYDMVFAPETHSLPDLHKWATPEYIAANASSPEVVRAATDALHGVGPAVDVRGQDKGCVLVALWAALRTAREYNGNVGESLIGIINRGGDTDTNAAISGALLGAGIGLDELVAQQRDNIEILLNCPYRFCTLRNVLGLQPRKVARLVEYWSRSTKIAVDAAAAPDFSDSVDTTTATTTESRKKQRTQ